MKQDGRYHFKQVFKVNFTTEQTDQHDLSPDLTGCEGYFTSLLFLPEMHSLCLVIRKY